MLYNNFLLVIYSYLQTNQKTIIVSSERLIYWPQIAQLVSGRIMIRNQVSHFTSYSLDLWDESPCSFSYIILSPYFLYQIIMLKCFLTVTPSFNSVYRQIQYYGGNLLCIKNKNKNKTLCFCLLIFYWQKEQ